MTRLEPEGEGAGGVGALARIGDVVLVVVVGGLMPGLSGKHPLFVCPS